MQPENGGRLVFNLHKFSCSPPVYRSFTQESIVFCSSLLLQLAWNDSETGRRENVTKAEKQKVEPS